MATTPRERVLSLQTVSVGSAGTLLGIEILDHIILGEFGRFVSLRDRGVL